MRITITIDQVTGGFFINGDADKGDEGSIPLDSAIATTKKQIVRQISGMIAPLFAEEPEVKA